MKINTDANLVFTIGKSHSPLYLNMVKYAIDPGTGTRTLAIANTAQRDTDSNEYQTRLAQNLM